MSDQPNSTNVADDLLRLVQEHGAPQGFLVAIDQAREQLRVIDSMLADLHDAIVRRAEAEAGGSASSRE